MEYTIEEHKHRFAAWAAGRAASVNGCRFNVETGKGILEKLKLNKVATVQNLPSPTEFDKKHREWRNDIIKAAKSYDLNFTHGVAAKLLNIYFKSVFICGANHENEKVKAVHPPIDSVLLEELYRNNVGNLNEEWKAAKNARWSKLDSNQYERVISAIQRTVPDDAGLWEIEKYWQGFQ